MNSLATDMVSAGRPGCGGESRGYVLLPLREKVSRRDRRVSEELGRRGLCDPSSDPFGATFSRKGEKDATSLGEVFAGRRSG